MSELKKITSHIEYIPPRLTEGKEWYISYYVIYPATGKLRRIKIKLNRFRGITKRREFAKSIMQNLSNKLASGWNPFIEAEAPKAFHKIFDVFETYLRVQEKESEYHSYRCYKSYIKFLKSYLLKNGHTSDMFVSRFDKIIASTIMLKIKQNPKYSFRTYNNYLQFFTTLFNWMIQFNYISINPFEHIKKIPKKLIHKTRECLNEYQRQQLKEFLVSEGNNNYLVMCLLCYYCFIRPNEISLLRVRDIDINNQLVLVSEKIAKNDKGSYRTIPDVMMEYVRELDLNQPPNYYLFSMDEHYKFIPGERRAEGREIARYWSDVIRVQLKWPKQLQFYSLKDTGITNMLADGVAPNFVQGQADHSNLKVTSIYAVSRNEKAQEQIQTKVSAF
jgi:integrase